MMKWSIQVLALFFMFIAPCEIQAQNNRSVKVVDFNHSEKDVKEATLKVKSLNVLAFPLGKQELDVIHSGMDVFDEQGALIETIKYNELGKQLEKTFYHPEFKKLIDKKYTYDDRKRVARIQRYNYNKKGIEISKETIQRGSSREETYVLSQLKDTLVVDKGYSLALYVNNKVVKEFAENGQFVTYFNYHFNGTLKEVKKFFPLSETIIAYDSKGRTIKVEETSLTSNGRVITSSTEITKYREDLLREKLFFSKISESQPIIKWIYNYNEDQELISIVKSREEITTPLAIYTYNKEGNIQSIKAGNVIISFDYIRFDAQGNWTERVALTNGTPYRRVTRNISYFTEEDKHK